MSVGKEQRVEVPHILGRRKGVGRGGARDPEVGRGGAPDPEVGQGGARDLEVRRGEAHDPEVGDSGRGPDRGLGLLLCIWAGPGVRCRCAACWAEFCREAGPLGTPGL